MPSGVLLKFKLVDLGAGGIPIISANSCRDGFLGADQAVVPGSGALLYLGELGLEAILTASVKTSCIVGVVISVVKAIVPLASGTSKVLLV